LADQTVSDNRANYKVSRAELEQAIAGGAEILGQKLPAATAAKLVFLINELARWGKRVNLTAIRDPREMVSAHILDSLAVRPLLNGRRYIDVGTGAGFPGLPIAICDEQAEIELLDSNGKKISFVQHVIGELGLPNASAIRARAEDYAPAERFDTVIARALASIPKLLQLAGHLIREEGVLLALKGKHPAAELESIEELPGWKYVVTDVTVPGLETHARHVVCLRRVDTA
jgi:16S rRNA (guanine527-N7)-methyltransferase